jgi:hypothetical protein
MGPNCEIRGHLADTLEFTLVKSGEAAGPSGQSTITGNNQIKEGDDPGFTTGSSADAEGSGSWECVAAPQTLKESDPVYKIELGLNYGGDGLQSMYVTHVTVSGKKYSRSMQYTRDVSLTNRNSGDSTEDTTWKATMPFNGDFPTIYTMTGHFFTARDHKLHYTEVRTQNGRPIFSMDSVCHWIGD